MHFPAWKNLRNLCVSPLTIKAMPNSVTNPSPIPQNFTLNADISPADAIANSLGINSLATTNASLVKPAPGALLEVSLTNNSAAAKFFKLYNKATAPIVGTDIPVLTIGIAANTEKAYEFGALGKRFPLGIGYAITNLQPVSDTTAIAAGDVIGSISWT